MRNPTDRLPLRLGNLPIHLLPSFVRLQPLIHLCFGQPSLCRRGSQSIMVRDIPFFLKVSLEEPHDNSILRLRPLRLRQLYQAVRVPRIPRFTAVLELDAQTLPNPRHTSIHHGCSIGTEPLVEELAFVDATFGEGGVEVERVPRYGEGVGGSWVGGSVESDGTVELSFTNIAPGADGVGDDGDGEVRHVAEGTMQCQDG